MPYKLLKNNPPTNDTIGPNLENIKMSRINKAIKTIVGCKAKKIILMPNGKVQPKSLNKKKNGPSLIKHAKGCKLFKK
ncbi:MAG: hypothetical protein QXU40_02335 [Candidatus Pacearchaeota archaeon]